MSSLPEQLDAVTVKLKANLYFDGGVISHTIISKEGVRRTVGLIRPGQYHFKTDAPERMDIIAGTCRVRLADNEEWKTYNGGETFRIAGKSSFDIKVDSGLAEYLCTFEP